MNQFVFVKDYKRNDRLRKSFNQLANLIFGLDFEEWYQKGFWNEKYIPYSILYHDEVVANVSVNRMDILMTGTHKKAIQIGTVMTHPDFRNKGLIRKLFEIILRDFEDQIDFIYLFANESVLNFYPKLGFELIKEKQFYKDIHVNNQFNKLRKLNIQDRLDFEFILRLTQNRTPISKYLAVKDDQALLMFYCLYVYCDDIYYLEEDECLILFRIEDNVLHLYDIISKKEIVLENIVNKIVDHTLTKVIYYFTPDYRTNNIKVEPLDSHLFIRKIKTDLSSLDFFRFPITSNA